MSDLDPVEFGEMRARLSALEIEVAEVRRDVKTLLALANQSRGGLWMGMTIAASFGAFATWAADKVLFR